MSLKRATLLRMMPHLPDAILRRALKGRSYLVPQVPDGREFVWPYYLDDTSVLVNTSNPIEREALTGAYDSEVTRHVRSFVRAGDVCVDGGANVGLVTLLLARTVGPSGRVYAVEPGEVYRERIGQNLDLNPELARIVKILPVGLSDKEETLRWSRDPNAQYNAGFLLPTDENWGDDIPTPLTTLDALARAESLTRLDFVKLDLEGMEWMALQGAREVLAKFRPAVLFESMEIYRDARGVPDVFRHIADLLAGEGYGLYHLTGEGRLLSVTTERLPDNTLALHGDDPRLG